MSIFGSSFEMRNGGSAEGERGLTYLVLTAGEV